MTDPAALQEALRKRTLIDKKGLMELDGYDEPDPAVAREALPEIRDRANVEARALWSRMGRL